MTSTPDCTTFDGAHLADAGAVLAVHNEIVAAARSLARTPLDAAAVARMRTLLQEPVRAAQEAMTRLFADPNRVSGDENNRIVLVYDEVCAIAARASLADMPVPGDDAIGGDLA